MSELVMPDASEVYFQQDHVVIFNQLARKIPMDGVSHADYYCWLDGARAAIGRTVPGGEIAEKPAAREAPPLNTAIYYDTDTRQILPTGALLRTSCNKITHAFCAFKMAEDDGSVRKDHRYVFADAEKRTIQQAPDSREAVSVVMRLLARQDIEHPGTFLERTYGIPGWALSPSIRLDSLRFTFFVWLDGRDALRCSIDRYDVQDLRAPAERRAVRPVAEVELAVYPRIAPEVAADPRVISLIDFLTQSLCGAFDTRVTRAIKYQRAAAVLGIA